MLVIRTPALLDGVIEQLINIFRAYVFIEYVDAYLHILCLCVHIKKYVYIYKKMYTAACINSFST